MLPVPPLFRLIQRASATPWAEMYRVFNCGHRMELYLPPKHAEAAIAVAKRFGIDARVVGRVEACDGPTQVHVRSEHGSFEYGK
jgi:phosphoribosylformylglycinamidine cyclo-ligase